jgi:N-acetylglucosaminyl-diphospho-decaprenol L-rhamnosyltransferase
MTPMLDVAVVSYRSRELLRHCLHSLSKHAPTSGARVHVVDNGSDDGTVEMLRREFPDVELMAMEENLGFAAGVNRVIRETTGRYVLVLNPDTRFVEPALDFLLDLMESRPEIGIAGCRLERADGELDHAAKRAFPTPLSALGHFTGLGRRNGSSGPLAAYRAPFVESGPVDAVNGAFMLIRREALESVGEFDEGYWMYMEDLDLCYRFAGAGWTTWYEPEVTVVHIKRGSTGAFRSLRLEWAFHYGMFRFYRKHYAAACSPTLNAIVYTGIGAKFAASATSTGVRRLLGRTRPDVEERARPVAARI